MENTSIYTFKDLESLKNLARIKNSDEIVDVYADGTVSAPYQAGYWASTCRTVKWISGYSQNRDAISTIRLLMQRAITNFSKGCEIESDLKEAVKGMRFLQEHYRKKNIDKTCEEIEEIIQYVERNILQINKNNRFPAQFDDQFFKANKLEGSFIGSPGVHDYQALKYYRDRIKDFITFEVNEEIKDDTEFFDDFEFRIIDHLSAEDCRFLKNLDAALEKTINSDLRGPQFWEKSRALAKKIQDEENIAWDKAFDRAIDLAKRQMSEELLDAFDLMPTEYQTQIGILIPMSFHWEVANNEKGHTFFLNLSKEPDGTYTAAQANAGAFALGGDIKNMFTSLFPKLHLNSGTMVSVSFPPIVEFPGLTREEAIQFLTKAYNSKMTFSKNLTEAELKYSSLFAGIEHKQSILRIPLRRSQITGNCTLRSLKELLIYSFQKSNKIDLGNKFMKYVDGRANETLPFDDIQPLQK